MDVGFKISSVRVESSPSHDHVRVFNRGALAGVLTVTLGDGDEIAERLMNGPMICDRVRVTEKLKSTATFLDGMGLPETAKELRQLAESIAW